MYIPTDEFLSTATDTELANRKKLHQTALGLVFKPQSRAEHRKSLSLLNDEVAARAEVAKARKAGALLSKFRQVTSTVAFG